MAARITRTLFRSVPTGDIKMKISVLASMVCLTLIAVSFSGVNQYRLARRVRLQTDQIAELDKSHRIRCRICQLLLSFDSRISTDVEIQKMVVGILELEALQIGYAPKLEDVDGEPGGLEMLALHHNSGTIPGGVVTVVALFRDSKCIDVVFRKASTRTETHVVQLTDATNDGLIDAVITVKPGFFRDGNPVETVVYVASEFELRNKSELIDW